MTSYTTLDVGPKTKLLRVDGLTSTVITSASDGERCRAVAKVLTSIVRDQSDVAWDQLESAGVELPSPLDDYYDGTPTDPWQEFTWQDLAVAAEPFQVARAALATFDLVAAGRLSAPGDVATLARSCTGLPVPSVRAVREELNRVLKAYDGIPVVGYAEDRKEGGAGWQLLVQALLRVTPPAELEKLAARGDFTALLNGCEELGVAVPNWVQESDAAGNLRLRVSPTMLSAWMAANHTAHSA